MTNTNVGNAAASSRRVERLAGAAVALAGAALMVATYLIPEPVRESPGMGPRVMPTIISVGLLVCGALLIATASRRHEIGVEESVLQEDQDDFMSLMDPDEPRVPWKGFLVVLTSLLAYAFLFIPLGFVLSTTLFLGGITTFADPARWVRNWIFAALLAGGVYLLFTQVLSVVLPAGVLG